MTDFEMITVFMELVSTLWTVFATYVSIVFAFLVVSFMASGKLRSGLVSIVIFLYSLVSLWALWAMNRGSVSLVGAAREMKRQIQDGSSSLGWHPAANTPEFVLAIIPFVVTLVGLLAYGGSLLFFFYQRRAERAST